MTQNWGASENEDLVHWGRFPAFRHIKHEAKRPRLTMDDRDRGAVFMRWKEKFLVPDHRVHDINGASFAGQSKLAMLQASAGLSPQSSPLPPSHRCVFSSISVTRRSDPEADLHRFFLSQGSIMFVWISIPLQRHRPMLPVTLWRRSNATVGSNIVTGERQVHTE